MRASETISGLANFDRRGPGTDAERRAGNWLADELEAAGREVRVETFWCRPNWALAHTWHVAVALAGSLVSVGTPRVGIGLLVAALVSIVADALTGVSPGRRLTPERASQNVVATPTAAGPAPPPAPLIRLIVTANYDAGRMGLLYRDPLRRAAARLRRVAGPMTLGWLGWLVAAVLWLLAIAALRAGGWHGIAISALQLAPTVALVLAVALLLELAASDFGPAAGDNASGTAVALDLVRALDAAPPHNFSVELVLAGAGEGGGIGLRKYLRARRRELRPADTVVLGVAATPAGTPSWWTDDGPLLPLRYSRPFTRLCASLAGQERHLQAAPHRGRGTSPALPARMARLPATTIGALDGRGVVPRSHQPSDRPETIDPAVLAQTTQFALMLVDALDAYLAGRRTAPMVTPAA